MSVPSVEIKGQMLMAGYDDGLDATVVEIPYEVEDLSLLVILPGKVNDFLAGGLEKLEIKMTSGSMNELTRKMSLLKVNVKLPKFEPKSAIELNQVFMATINCLLSGE